MVGSEYLQKNRSAKRKNLLNGLYEYPPDTPIYRVFRRRHLLKTLRTGRNVLVKPKMWDDPFENVVFQKTSFMLGREQVETPTYLRERFYGQCWTLNQEETDALWRIYSPEKDGVRVKSTIGSLFDALYDENNWRAWASYYMGRVLYKNEKNIVAFLKRGISAAALADWRWTASTLLFKRLEFSHENEVRVLFIEYRLRRAQRYATWSYKVDPNKTFTEMLCDPRMPQDDFRTSLGRIRALGYRGPVKHSQLYQIPSVTVRVRKRWDPGQHRATLQFTSSGKTQAR